MLIENINGNVLHRGSMLKWYKNVMVYIYPLCFETQCTIKALCSSTWQAYKTQKLESTTHYAFALISFQLCAPELIPSTFMNAHVHLS
jgi:hypothetical protein